MERAEPSASGSAPLRVPLRVIVIADRTGGTEAEVTESILDRQLRIEGFEVSAGDLGTAAELMAALPEARVLIDGPANATASILATAGPRQKPLILAAPEEAAAAEAVCAGDLAETMAKPVRLAALLARLRATPAARAAESGAEETPIGQLRFRATEKLLLDPKGIAVRLTEKEVAILTYLIAKGPGTVTRDALLGAVWGYNSGVETHTLETHVYRLRQKLQAEPAILVTEPGGYRLAV